MYRIYKQVIPRVHAYLEEWKAFALRIPDEELRKQALLSIETKTFHCEGGAVYGLLAGEKIDDVIRFIVAYQTISDYLDNLCDRSTSMDPYDFRALHESMTHALTPGAPTEDYYRFRAEQEDGGYLQSLVQTCQNTVSALPNYESVRKANLELASYYADLQVYKHIHPDKRVSKLKAWFESNKEHISPMRWYEFGACTGSTLGIFCLTAYAANEDFSPSSVDVIKNGYFPWVQGLHILMDYFIDQEEDKAGGDLNFCFYYEDDEDMIARMQIFAENAEKSIARLPDASFHRLINKGLLAIYLADEKVKRNPTLEKQGKALLRNGGAPSIFFYVNGWMYRRKSKT
nr:tetraprenyl-beta-curcumene synthase family protein [Texcoconibacillus texcoconensis]